MVVEVHVHVLSVGARKSTKKVGERCGFVSGLDGWGFGGATGSRRWDYPSFGFVGLVWFLVVSLGLGWMNMGMGEVWDWEGLLVLVLVLAYLVQNKRHLYFS